MPRPFKRKRTKNEEVRNGRRDARGEQTRRNVKRRKLAEQETIFDHTQDYVSLDDGSHEQPSNDDTVFYGFLKDDEQAYYTNINTKIIANDFDSEEDQQTFIEAVHRESAGKELKLASSQSCSRYLERLMLVSSPEQLATLFEKLLEGISNLSQHRFGSHVLETLFVESAKFVQINKLKKTDSNNVSDTLEHHFVNAAKALEPNFGFLITHRFGSHVVRTLVLVLSGEPLQDAGSRKVLASKKKEKLDTPNSYQPASEEPRIVPESFKTALSDLITTAVSKIDGTYLRALATHPTGNPVLQILLKIELTSSDKGRNLGDDSLFHKLFSPSSLADDSEGAKLVSGLMYDSTGSHLVEIIVQHAPGKVFKKLYKSICSSRMASMVKNDVASYVAMKILQRLGKDDLAVARDTIVRELPALFERRRFQAIQTLVDRCVVRGIDVRPLAEALKSDFRDERSQLVRKIAAIEVSSAEDTDVETIKADSHGCSLGQTLLKTPLLNDLVQESLLATDSSVLGEMAQDASASRMLQTALTSSESGPTFRKRLIRKFYHRVVDLAISPSGSYFVESLWDGTRDLHFLKEQIASELAKHESVIRDSQSGRNVWRTWMMDLYARRRVEWQFKAKGRDDNAAPAQIPKMSNIQLAAARYTHERTRQDGNRQNGRLKAVEHKNKVATPE